VLIILPFDDDDEAGLGCQCGIEGFEQYLETKTIGVWMPRTT
jgi:aldehyde dehydrogenase (NAD+)